MNAEKTPSVPAVERALHILELLASSKAGLTLSQIVEASGLPKSSLHCLLLTLERSGYLYRNRRTSRYMFGTKLFSLANTSLGGLRIREQAMPHLFSLMQQTGLTVHMAILEHGEAVLVTKSDPPGVSPLATWPGKRMELHCTGVGKALAAYMPEAELDAVLRLRGLPRHNENTVASIRRLKDDLVKVRRLGYAYEDEEDEIGLRCIGVPVLTADGTAVAAISIAGDTDRIRPETLAYLVGNLQACAQSISRTLGYETATERTTSFATA